MKKIFISILTVVGMMTSCSDEMSQSLSFADDMPINISAEYPVKGVSTRATDNGFVQDDAIGLFVVDYNSDGTPGELVMKGNRADNVKFEYNGASWTANYQLYWANKSTPADFYGYYPFNSAMQSATEYTFAVYTNQDGTTAGKSNYEQSDFLWAKAEKVQPTTDAVQLTYKHLMAGITVQLQMGTGFDATEWVNLEKTVLVDNVKNNGIINLQTGKVTLNDNAEVTSITPLIYNNVWRAVVVPQAIAAGKRVLSITVDGKNYGLVKDEDVQYISGKMHNFTITVNKNTATGEYSFELAADDIVAWVDDADMHEGLVRQYIIVDVNEPGTLSKVMKYRGIEADKVTALKVTGNINHCDMVFMGQQMTNLSDLNIAKVALCADEHLEAGVLTGFAAHKPLRHIVFPETGMKVIGDEAFMLSGLTGSLTIPEGVVEIGNSAFLIDHTVTSKFFGTLTLPSTLKKIGPEAFAYQDFHGELILPEGLEYMSEVGEGGCFRGCSFTGSLLLPSSLTSMMAPSGSFSGTITVPKGVTSFRTLYNPWDPWEIDFTVDNGIIELHEGMTELFISGCKFAGELVLPSTIRQLKDEALAGNKFRKIILDDNLTIIGDKVMADNERLETVVLSRNISRIPKSCFENCTMLNSITIPANVEIIDNKAFCRCIGLSTILCEATEPPAMGEDVFQDVNKDKISIEVPKGCVNKYKEAEGWKEFKRIAEHSNFVCRPAQANALNKVHSEQLVLNADGAWTVKSCPDWIHLSQTSGTGKTQIQLTFLELAHGAGNRETRIIFDMNGAETYCDVTQYDYEYDEDSYLTLQTHSVGNGIDIIFMGDGWTGEQISNGEYLAMVNEQKEYFFGIEPYKSHREYFNVYVTFPLSQEKGVNTMNTYVNNRFGTLYGYDGTDCTLNQLLLETDEAFKYAVDKTPLTEGNKWKSQIILIPNSNEYEGVTYYDGECALSLCPPSIRPYPQDTRGVVQHEACGHGFGKQGDESIKKQAWATPDIQNKINAFHSLGWYKNLSTTSKMSQLAWADFIFDTRYSDQVDVYEGGFEYMRGVFRPENNSCMNYGIPYFNVMSRLDIMRRIREYSGMGWSMDYFYAHDTNKWGDTDGTTRAGTAHASFTGKGITGNNMHRSPSIINPKKMGDEVRRIREKLRKP